MKRPLLLLLGWLYLCPLSGQEVAPKHIPKFANGLTLPQLITTKIDQTTLHYQADYESIESRRNIGVYFNKFMSDDRSQFYFWSNALLGIQSDISREGGIDHPSSFQSSATIGANLKFFNSKSYFLELGTTNAVYRRGKLFENNGLILQNSLEFALGKGRINYINDGIVALAIIDKLKHYHLLIRDLYEEEYLEFTKLIRNLKNRRRLVNRSFPLTEVEEIQDYLVSIDVIEADRDITNIINQAYKFDPILARTSGSQFRIAISGQNSYSNVVGYSNRLGLETSISYIIHSAINTQWQYNKGISGYLVVLDSSEDDLLCTESGLQRAGIGMENNFHYILDNQIKISLLTTTGLDLINRAYNDAYLCNPYIKNEGLYLKTSTEIEYQITRTLSTSIGVNLYLQPDNTFTGISFGLKF